VQALWKTEAGTWAEEDWTEYEWIGFCRDLKQQRISDLVIVVSNADKKNSITAPKAPSFRRNNIGCWGYGGTASRTYMDKSWKQGGKVEVKAAVNFTASFAPFYTNKSEGKLRVMFTGPLFSNGTVTISEDYTTTDSCRYLVDPRSFQVDSLFQGGTTTGLLFISYFNEALPDEIRADLEDVIGPSERAYFAEGHTDQGVKGKLIGDAATCGDDDFYFTNVGSWLNSDPDPSKSPTVQRNGHLKSTYIDTDGETYIEIFVWDLEPLREP
jgi:hypothetical protein